MQAIEEFVSKYGRGARRSFIREHILNNFYAFEIKMAPYAIGHLRISFPLDELGYKLGTDERLRFYLTNALEMEELAESHFPGMVSLSEESHLAAKVKKEQPILVILGNPPYFGRSSNFGEWISQEIRAYYEVDGHPLKERNPKVLQDDYVKFIRFAQWKIDQTGEGILGFITNHSYLDNVTFRGMRQSLMKSFDEIYVLDLHGNSVKREKCPDGSKDENVFDIRQGVAISIFVKKKGEHGECKVYQSEVWGLREKKYDWLLRHDIRTTDWQELSPRSESYLFIPWDDTLWEEYERYLKVTDIFLSSSVGIATARDKLTIKWTPDEVWETILDFSQLGTESARTKYNLRRDVRDWKVELAQKDLIDSGFDRAKIKRILYRPFDIRYTYYTGNSRGFHCMPRPEIMRHMIIGQNMGLVLPKRVETQIPWGHVLCTTEIIDHVTVSLKTIDYLFPLYVHPDESYMLKHSVDPQTTLPNIKPELLGDLSETYGKKSTPEELFYYIYALLHSNTYRVKYNGFLRRDFPRIPFTRDHKLFSLTGSYGKRLSDLHLLESEKLDRPIARFQGEGDRIVQSVKYNQEKGYVYINRDQYFEGVPKEVWEYHIGGYQVCAKWLKDRKSRTLSLDEIRHYCRIATALQKTIEIQKEIDDLYPELEKEIIQFRNE